MRTYTNRGLNAFTISRSVFVELKSAWNQHLQKIAQGATASNADRHDERFAVFVAPAFRPAFRPMCLGMNTYEKRGRGGRLDAFFKLLTISRRLDTITHPRRSCAERSSCRVAEGFGPDDATTTGPAQFNWSQVPIPARFAGDMKLGETAFGLVSPTRNEAFFLARRGPAQPGDRYERTLHVALPGM